MNQTKEEYTILNYDDINVRKIGEEVNSNITWFSLDNKLDKGGVYLEEEYVVINTGEK